MNLWQAGLLRAGGRPRRRTVTPAGGSLSEEDRKAFAAVDPPDRLG